MPRSPSSRQRHRRRITAHRLDDEALLAAAERTMLDADLLAGRLPAGARRAMFDHELDAGVNFAELTTSVDARAGRIGERLTADRQRFAELLRADLEQVITANPALAADTVVAGRLGDLLDPSRFADPVAGTEALVAEAERFHAGELAQAVSEGMTRAVAEARAQGIVAGHLPTLPAEARDRLDVLARRLAAAPHADVVVAARHAADAVAGAGLDATAVVDHVATAVDSLSTAPLDRYARPAAQSAHNLGHQETAATVPGVARIYASELLDRNTCGPCSLIDGNEYDSEAEALADYPTGTYVDCEGGDACRGTLVYVWQAEAPATVGPPPPDAPPYPSGTSRRIPQPPSAPTGGLPAPPTAPTSPPLPPAPALPTPPPLEPAVADIEPLAEVLPDVPELAAVDDAAVAEARGQIGDVRAEVRQLAAQVRSDALADLERADALRIATPPPLAQVRNLVTGNMERRAQAQGYDWFYSLSQDEQRRLRRQWFAEGGLSPDELGAHWAERTGREVTTEQAAGEWLELTRRADAGGLLARGRLLQEASYGGADVNAIIASPYDLRVVFGNDLDVAAAHIAGVTADLSDRVVEDTFRPAILGEAPYRLTVDEFTAEVTELEARVADIVPLSNDPEFGPTFRREDQAVYDRLRELIPDGVEDPAAPLPLNELHDAIVNLARRARLL